jgi:hypothetical protein
MAARNQFLDDIGIHLGTDGTVLLGIRPDNGEDPQGDEDTLYLYNIEPTKKIPCSFVLRW